MAAADTPAVRQATAPMVDPSTAWSQYGSATAHTSGMAAWTTTPPEIKALARSLGAERLASSLITIDQYAQNVSDYVRNNIATEFRFGLGKGGRGALIDQSGTPFDAAELMVKLLREGNVPASYQVGTINLTPQQFGQWSGLVKNLNEGAQTFDVDAQATCQFLADGGIPAVVNGASNCSTLSGNLTALTLGHIWVSANGKLYDPAIKRQTLKAGIDLSAAMGCGSAGASTCGNGATSAVLSGATQSTYSGAPSISNLNEVGQATQLSSYAAALQTTIQSSLRDAPIEAIVGGELPDTTYAPVAGSSLPYTATSQFTWTGDVPDQFRTLFKLGCNGPPTTLYADELAGRRVTIDAGEIILEDGPQITTTGCEISGPIDLTIGVDHPYIANSKQYGDETIDFGNEGDPTKATPPPSLVLQLGNAGPSTTRYNADYEHYLRQPNGAGSSTQHAGQIVSQQSRAARLVGGVTQTKLIQHHSVGVVWAYSDISTRVSVDSAVNDASNSSKGLNLYAVAQEMLEGSVYEQSQDSWPIASVPSLTSIANGQSQTFINVTAANVGGVGNSLLLSNTQLQALTSAGYSLILATTSAGYVSFGAHSMYVGWGTATEWKSDTLAYLVGANLKGGGGPLTAPDPLKAAKDSTENSAATLRMRKLAAVSLADGSVTLTPAADLVTGAGEFPFSLSFQRRYSSSSSYDERSAQWGESLTADLYDGAGAGAPPFLGGGKSVV